MRAKLLSELQGAGKSGITFDTLHDRCSFKNPKSTRDALGLLNRKNGFGIVAEDSIVRLT